MKNFIKSIGIKFKSWAVWVSLGGLIVFCVKEFAGVDISKTVDGFLNVLCGVLAAFGILNNPDARDHF